MSSVCESIAKSVMFIGTAFEIWSQLEIRFSLSNGSRKYKLSKDTFGISQQGSFVSEYYTRMKCVWEEWDSMNNLPRLVTITPEISVFLSVVEKQKEEQRKWMCNDSARRVLKGCVQYCTRLKESKVSQELEKLRKEEIENLMRNVLKDMKPGASTGDCTDDELEFVARQVQLKNGILLKDDLRTRRVHGLDRKIGGLYHLLNVPMDQVDAKLRIQMENSDNSSLFSCSAGVYNKAVCPNMYSLWHHRLGHISVTKMKHVQSSDIHVVNDNETTYLTCPMAKLIKLPYAYSESCSGSVFELIHMDTWGPYKVPTNGKYKYFLTIVDDFSRATWTYLMVKFDALNVVKAFLKFVELQFKTKGDCVITATYLINRVPLSVLQNRTPYEKLLHKVLDYSNLRVFGCFVVATNPLRVVDKFAPRVFHEHIFPFDESSSKNFFQPMHVSMLSHTHTAVYDDCELVLTKDFDVPTLKPAANKVTSPVLSSQFFCFLSTLVTKKDPKGFKEAIRDAEWCDAMNAELRALEENGT
ncbi:cysteine-rich receptor-like protein kinase 8 [Tanacetum coccineum]